MKVDINVTEVYRWLEQSKARINILRGGTGSSKSYSLSQYFAVNKLCGEGKRTLVIARKTLPALKKTAYKETMDIIDSLGIPYKLNKTDLELRVKDNICYFMSLDDPHKVASFQTDDVWLEEAIDFTFEDFHQFNMRMNGQMYLSFNPVSALHWIKTILIDSGNYNAEENVSTYKDNPYLAITRRKEIENLIKIDQNFYKIYNLGEWGVLGNIIYSKWDTFDKLPEKIDFVTYSCDWGFNDPSVITEINWIDGKFIARELFYCGGLTHVELIEEAKKIIPEEFRDRELYIDSAEPGLIQAFYQEGFNAHRSKKDVIDGINYVKTHMLGVTKDSIHGIKELSAYSWKKDKNGNVIDTPIDFNNHFCDTIRYGSFSHDIAFGTAQTSDIAFR